uniref:Uncharacterized protein n=1 Tax=Callorhinchus milii TaxID=7868 RepID=A0A4W3JKC1_CALMI
MDYLFICRNVTWVTGLLKKKTLCFTTFRRNFVVDPAEKHENFGDYLEYWITEPFSKTQ